MNRQIPSADYLRSFLMKIYKCNVPFELQIIDKRPKTKMGVYINKNCRIRIYSKWIDCCPLEEIAIHEYAHHIQNTEKGGIFGRGAERAHGEYFWRIYSALMSKAVLNGLYNDTLTEDIILQ